MKPSQVARRRASHTIIFGDPKTGKSTLVSKLLLQGFRLTWISMDNGHEVIFKLPIPPTILDERLDLIVIPDTRENPIAIGTCRKIMTGAALQICFLHGRVDCPVCTRNKEGSSRVCLSEAEPRDIFVFDHAGQIATSCMNAILKNTKGGMDDDFKVEWDQYRQQGTVLEGFYTNIQQSLANIIVITHNCETEMEDGKKKLVPLIGTVPFSRNSGKYFDHMIYCEMGSGAHKFASSSIYKSSVVTGSRSDVKIEEPEKGEKEPSLKRFFDGSIKAPLEAGNEEAKKFLTNQIQQAQVKEALNVEQALAATRTSETLTEELPSGAGAEEGVAVHADAIAAVPSNNDSTPAAVATLVVVTTTKPATEPTIVPISAIPAEIAKSRSQLLAEFALKNKGKK